MNSATTPAYTTRTNKHGQTDVIRAENASEPHVYVRWYDGDAYRRTCVPASQADTYRVNESQRSVTPAVWVAA